MLPKLPIPWRARKAAKEFAQQVAKYSAKITNLRWNATTVHANLAGSAMAGMNSLAVTKEILRAAGYQPPAEPDPVPVETDAPKPPTPPKQGGATANARFTLEQEAAADGVARLLGYLPRRASSLDEMNPVSVPGTDCSPDTSAPTGGTSEAPDSTQPDRGES